MLNYANNKKYTLVALTLFAVIIIAAGFIFGTGVVNVAYAAEDFAVSAKSAYLIEEGSGAVIFSKNENERLPIASMMKIMTTLIAFEAIDQGKLSLDEEIIISDQAAGMGGSQVFLDAGSAHKVSELLKSIIVASANDSSVAIAERLGGSVSGFVDMMNARASELGMENTHFVNCTGLPAPESFSSAKDSALMFKELIKHPKYFDYSHIWLEDYAHPSGRKTTITNTNKLVRFYKGCDGGKTGFTSEAKFCLTATAKRDNMRLIGVVIGESSSEKRFGDVSNMFNTAFNNYSNKVIVSKGDNIPNSVEVVGGKKDSVNLTVDKNLAAFQSKKEGSKFDVKFELPSGVKAKINSGDVIGKAYLTKDGVVIDEANVIASEAVGRISVFDAITKIGNSWLSYKK